MSKLILLLLSRKQKLAIESLPQDQVDTAGVNSVADVIKLSKYDIIPIVCHEILVIICILL
jgi:hypothetical protein